MTRSKTLLTGIKLTAVALAFFIVLVGIAVVCLLAYLLAKGDPGILTAETMAHFDKMITDAEAEFAEEDKKNK